MNTHDNSNPPDKKLPLPGVIAGEVLKTVIKEPDIVQMAPSFPTVDTNYIEPKTAAEFKLIFEAVGATARDAQDVIGDMDSLIKLLLKRIEALEDGLLPFATQALMLANMHMCLAAEGRSKEPAGGTWLNGINNATMQPNEKIFYFACDVLGRAQTEQRVMNIFAKVQEATAALVERDKLADDAHREGPIGGPVSGKSH